VPEETARVAQAAFPKGHPYLTLRDELDTIYPDSLFAPLFSTRGQPDEAPGHLALGTVLQFAEGWSDRQAAEAVRSRIDWQYLLGWELEVPGFDFSILREFRKRLIEGSQEQQWLAALWERCRGRGLVQARGQQRTDAPHVQAAVRHHNRVACVGETMRQALHRLARVAPPWLKAHVLPAWYERYGPRFEAAIIEPGHDAAALLQRIGRVARGPQPGIVHVSKPQREVPTHFIRLQQCEGIIPVLNLRETFEPLRQFSTTIAKELGRAYWSMLRRHDKYLMAGLEEAFVDIMGDDVAMPGRLLDSLWKTERCKFRDHSAFMAWLKAIDDTLQDLRGFAPTVKLKFQDRYFTYSRDWVTKYLRPPDNYDTAEETYVYHDEIERCLREKAQPLQCRFFCPKGKTGSIATWTVSYRDLWPRYKQYLNQREYPSKPDIRQLYELATHFIQRTGLMPRADKTAGELIESDII
jgi:transposase